VGDKLKTARDTKWGSAFKFAPGINIDGDWGWVEFFGIIFSLIELTITFKDVSVREHTREIDGEVGRDSPIALPRCREPDREAKWSFSGNHIGGGWGEVHNMD